MSRLQLLASSIWMISPGITTRQRQCKWIVNIDVALPSEGIQTTFWCWAMAFPQPFLCGTDSSTHSSTLHSHVQSSKTKFWEAMKRKVGFQRNWSKNDQQTPSLELGTLGRFRFGLRRNVGHGNQVPVRLRNCTKFRDSLSWKFLGFVCCRQIYERLSIYCIMQDIIQDIHSFWLWLHYSFLKFDLLRSDAY